ncbi:hypothetical protein QSV34_10675 [Porticoccus sp. W117]|uniref:hypothetical protein n=1 Tax=Porticoccus sp. W117 TaxID=3054777 RepID=UPI0025944588|nr:hypothetical protein [Porticoccus sp. W117]MDM3871815.1 hypothetical protein [Porticoccus sp. W117]
MLEIIKGVFALIILVWLALCVTSLIYPIKPFKKRRHALGAFVVSFVLASIYGGVNGPSELPSEKLADDESTKVEESKSAISSNANLSNDIPDSCGEGGIRLNDVVAVTQKSNLYSAASKSSQRVKNLKLSKALGTNRYHTIDPSVTVKRLCVQKHWTEVQITSPEWLSHVIGWVDNSSLKEIVRNSKGKRLYSESDFFWDNDTTLYKADIVQIINKISSENKNCSEIDTGTVMKSGSRSKPNDPVFFVTCVSNGKPFNVWFKPSDANNSNDFSGVNHIGRASALNACEAYAKSVANYPSTVDFSKILDAVYIQHPSGRAQMISTFTAKNGFNLKLKYRVRCLFEGSRLIEASISEET